MLIRAAMATLATIALLLTAFVPAASAEDSGCIVSAALPSKISILPKQTKVPLAARESADGCLRTARLEIRALGVQAFDVADAAHGTTWRSVARMRPGTYRIDARDAEMDLRVGGVMRARYGTRISFLHALPDGFAFTRAFARVETASSRGWTTSTRRDVVFQWRTSGRWHTFSRTRSDAAGRVTARMHDQKDATETRVIVRGTARAWGADTAGQSTLRPRVPTPPTLPSKPRTTPEGTFISAAELLETLTVRPEDHSKPYDRDLFGYDDGLDADNDRCMTRKEVLIRDSLVPVVRSASCSVKSGSWVSMYDGVRTTDPSDLEVDHLVALAEAWYSGADRWPHDRQVAFGNDVDYIWDLQAVTIAENRVKGAGDPTEWMPEQNRCTYVKAFVAVKYRWGLSVDSTEKKAMQRELTSCASLDVLMPGTPDIHALSGL